MPSSISNSSARAPEGPWGRTWAAAILIALGVLAGLELFLRSEGFQASVNDDAGLWALVRRGASTGERSTVVLAGSSRLQLGINTAEFARAGGRKPLQLAVFGSSPLPILEDLAEDPLFRGMVICEVTLKFLFDGDEDKPHERRARDYIARHRRSVLSPAARVEQNLVVWLTSCLVFRSPEVSFAGVLQALRGHAAHRVSYVRTEPDRSRRADFVGRVANSPQPAAQRAVRKSPVPAAEAQVECILQHAEELVDKIAAKGGEVVFLMLPTDGKVRADEERSFPKARYWDALKRRVGRVGNSPHGGPKALTICYEDHEGLRGYAMPEGSHLDYRDAISFTRALCQLLKPKLDERSAHP